MYPYNIITLCFQMHTLYVLISLNLNNLKKFNRSVNLLTGVKILAFGFFSFNSVTINFLIDLNNCLFFKFKF